MRGRVDDSMVRNIDVVPTIGDMLGRSIWWPHDGDSVFSPASKNRDELVMTTRDFKREIRIDADSSPSGAPAEHAGRAYSARVRTASGPSATHGRASTASGPTGRCSAGGWRGSTSATRSRPRCTRRSPATLAARGCGRRSPAPSSSTRWRRARRSGRPRAPGGSRNGSAYENRDLALVVNGRIRAVGRSFHLGRRPTEFFSFVFPEHALRRGRNRRGARGRGRRPQLRAAGRQSRRRAVDRVGTGAAALRRAPAPGEQAFVNSW